MRTAVPPHIGTGTRIVVMTEDGSYVERAKDSLKRHGIDATVTEIDRGQHASESGAPPVFQ